MHLRLVDVIETARNNGFDVRDGRDMPVDATMLSLVEEENLMDAPARLHFPPIDPDRDRDVVAEVSVGAQLFRIVGDVQRQADLRQVFEGRGRLDPETG